MTTVAIVLGKIHRIETQLHFTYIRMIQVDIKVVIIRITVPRRIVAFSLSVTIRAVFLRTRFIHIQITSGDLAQGNNIRIIFPVKVYRSGEHLLSFIYVQVVSVRSNDPAWMEGTYQPAVFLTHLKLIFDLLQCTVPSVVKPRRKLLRTVLAEIAILQFTVSQHTDLFSAYIAEFFIKKSHGSLLLFHIIFIKNITALRTEFRRLCRIFRFPAALVTLIERGSLRFLRAAF